MVNRLLPQMNCLVRSVTIKSMLSYFYDTETKNDVLYVMWRDERILNSGAAFGHFRFQVRFNLDAYGL